MSIEAGDALPESLGAPAGARTRVLYFMRAGSCAVCRGHVKRLAELAPELAALGVEVTVFVPEPQAPAWIAALGLPVVAGPAAYVAAGFGLTLATIQQSGTIVAGAGADGRVVAVRRATLPFLAFAEGELLALLRRPAETPAAVT